jgi:hypothetical protein
MIWFKSKREKDLEQLVKLQQEKIDNKEREDSRFIYSFTTIQVPRREDMVAYWQKLQTLITDPLFVFYLTKMRTDILMGIEENGQDKYEFFRGMLATNGQLFKDARKAQAELLKGGADEA